MQTHYDQIEDANLNRIAEGLRVIEEYVRFVTLNKKQTDQLAAIRKQVNLSETRIAEHLGIRNTEKDMRAKETPTKRKSILELLKANFKRVEEGLRVLEEYTGNTLYNQLRYDCYLLEKEILLPLARPQIKPGVYLISDQIDVLKQGLDWGVSLIQLRDKSLHKAEYFNKLEHLQPIAKSYGIPFIVNDYADIALLLDADGFHTGQDDLDITTLRNLFGPHKLLGRTTHTLEQGLEAQAQGADYVSVGPLWETPSKPGRAGIGLSYLEEARAKLSIPYVAIGSISPDTIEQVMRYEPPLVGLIRSYEMVPGILKRYF